MFKKAIVLIVTLFAFCFCGSALDLSAESAVLYETTTGKVLYEKNMNKPMGMASTTKIMTALVVLENVNPEDIVTIKESCTKIEGSSIYLKAGERISVYDLLHGLMLESGNDAAAALADYVGRGDTGRFVALMNRKAKILGLKNTHFTNPSGLPDEGHYSTAFDMARLAACAMESSGFREIVSKRTYSAGGRFMKNHNRFLTLYKGAEGVKTGFTRAAGRCLVSSVMSNGVRLIAVTLSAPNDWRDHINLYDYGYNNYSRRVFLKASEKVASLPVAGCEKPVRIDVLASCEILAVLSKEELEKARLEIHLPRFLYAPVEKGEIVGVARLYIDDNEIERINLLSEGSAGYFEKPGLFDILRGIIRRTKK